MKTIQQWRKWSGEKINQPIVDEVRSVLERECDYELKVCVGTDGQ